MTAEAYSANHRVGPSRAGFPWDIRARLMVKWLSDRSLALFLLIAFAPAILLLLLLIFAGDRGNPIYGHQRIGRNGRVFRCLKLRSMHLDSAARLAELLANDAEAAAYWAENHKLKNDPRVLPLGRFIRSTSLDELPQLFNILRGEMSFVGPRPVTAAEMDRYGAIRRHYESVAPGLTGLWQVSGRSDCSYTDRVALDRRYVETWGLRRDLSILLKTPIAVLAMAGAC